MRDFFGCYLLTSKAPQAKGRTYIGFTVNPRRRIRQHNGLITAGAWKTSKWRPWEMTLVLFGFPTKIQALQFEWAWQHPQKSLIVRPIAQALGSKKLMGLRGKILLMLSMLHESPWRHFPLTLQYLQPEYASMVKESVASAPSHVRVFTAPMEELPLALDDMDEDGDSAGDGERGRDGTQRLAGGREVGSGGPDAGVASGGEGASGASDVAESGDEELTEGGPPGLAAPAAGHAHLNGADMTAAGNDGDVGAAAGAAAAVKNTRLCCEICHVVIQRHILVCSACGVTFHLDCLAARWSSIGGGEAGSGGGGSGHERARFGGVPEQGHCPACGGLHSWMAMLEGMQTIGWGNKPRGKRRQAKKAPKAVAAVEALPPPQDAADKKGAAEAGPAAKGRKRAAKPKAALANEPLSLPQTEDAHVPISLALEEPPLLRTAAQQEQLAAPAAKPGRKPCGGAAAALTVKARRTAAAAAAAPPSSDPPEALTEASGIEPGRPQADGVGLESVPAAPAAAGPKRVAKPRAPRGRAAAAAAGASAAQADDDVGVGTSAKHGPTASGYGGEHVADGGAVPLTAIESPPKRRRQARKPRASQQQEESQRDGRDASLQGRPLATAASGSGEPYRTGAADLPGGSPDLDLMEASPLPLWQRLQARFGSATASAPAAAPRAPGPREFACGDISTSSSASEDEDADDVKPCAIALAGAVSAGTGCGGGGDGCKGRLADAEASGLRAVELPLSRATQAPPEPRPRQGRNRASPRQQRVTVIIGTTSEESDTDADEGRRGVKGVLETADGAFAVASLPGSGPPSVPWREDRVSSPAALLGPGLGRQAEMPCPSPMDTSPQRCRATAAAGTAVEEGATFGSPVWSDPGLGSGSGQGGPGAAEAGGSAGGGVTTLMAQLQCGSTASPMEELGGTPEAWVVHQVGHATVPVVSTTAHPAAAALVQDSQPAAIHVPVTGPVAPRPAGCARQQQWQAGSCEDSPVVVVSATCGERAGIPLRPPRAQPFAQVVDLCSPLPQNGRLAGQAAAAAAEEGPAAWQAGHVPGKRLRSPKPLPAAAAAAKDSAPGRPPEAPDGKLAGALCQGLAVGPAEEVPGGWSLSPWPVRQRRECQGLGARGGEEGEEGGDVSGEEGGASRGATLDPEVGADGAGAGACGVSGSKGSVNDKGWAGQRRGGPAAATGAEPKEHRSADSFELRHGGSASDDDEVIIID